MVRLARAWAAAGCVVATSVLAEARPATISDFAICNQQATDRVGSPSAAAGPGDRPRGAPPDLHRPGARTAPSISDSAAGGLGTGTDSSGKIIAGAPDVLLEGMAADRADDLAYRSMYRECMTRRGVTARPAP